MQNLESIYKRFLKRQCSPQEVKQLLDYFHFDEADEKLVKLIEAELEKEDGIEVDSPEVDAILSKNRFELKERIHGHVTVTPLRRKNNRIWYSAVATLLIAFSMTLYFYKSDGKLVVEEEDRSALIDIAPGGNKAILTLGDGTKIDLDEIKLESIAQENGIFINKPDNGQIVYEIYGNEPVLSENITYNTISTPKGGQYKVTLPDGTSVWLNAASSLTYPTRFIGTERRVELKGEGYFEVASIVSPASKARVMPFVVETEDQEVEVLGTHFNINSYVEETVTKTTLLEGSVIVKDKKAHALILTPGKQSVLQNGLLSAKVVPAEEATAWKDGYFQFNESSLSSIMRQMTRWYDIDVVFKGKISDELFYFKTPRNIALSELLKIFEMNGINIKREGRTLIIVS